MELFKHQVWINFLGLLPGSLVTVLAIAVAFLRFYDEKDFRFLSIVAQPQLWSNRLTVQPSWLHWPNARALSSSSLHVPSFSLSALAKLTLSALSGTVEIEKETARLKQENAKLREQNAKLAEREKKLAEVDRKLDEIDRKYAIRKPKSNTN